LASSGRERYH